MIAEKKSVETFRKKYNISKVNKKVLCSVLEKQGYTIIPFSRYSNQENVDFLIDSLGVQEYINSCNCFTFHNEKYRLIFLNKDLNEEEKVVVLAHEQGHIWHKHMISESVLGKEVAQELEANEFAHYLLKDADGSKKRRRKIVAVIVTFLLLGTLVIWGVLKLENNQRVYKDNYYRTVSGGKYHIEGCVYLKHKTDIQKLTREEFETGDYEPCAVCIPFEK